MDFNVPSAQTESRGNVPDTEIIEYQVRYRLPPKRIIKVQSAWKGIENILADLIEHFRLGTRSCLEFGVEFGFSTVALSSFFGSVIGVDTFVGDIHTVNKDDIYKKTVRRLSKYKNIRLIKSDYKDWIKTDKASYDLIHVDIVHSYVDTYDCGLWSAQHSQCAIFHDTESFPDVKRAVLDVAKHTGKAFYNFKESNGLGIVV